MHIGCSNKDDVLHNCNAKLDTISGSLLWWKLPKGCYHVIGIQAHHSAETYAHTLAALTGPYPSAPLMPSELSPAIARKSASRPGGTRNLESTFTYTIGDMHAHESLRHSSSRQWGALYSWRILRRRLVLPVLECDCLTVLRFIQYGGIVIMPTILSTNFAVFISETDEAP